MLLTNTVEPNASDVISEAWFYAATHFLTEIWIEDAGIKKLTFSFSFSVRKWE